MPSNEPFVPWMRSLLERMKELYGKANAKTIAEALPDGNFFKIKGSVSTASALPISGNDVGDIYIVSEDGSEHIWVTSESHPNGYWEKLGADIVVDAAAVASAIHAMTAAQKAGVLSDIGAASSGDLPDVSDVVRTSIQDLSSDAQEQARLNIGATSIGDVDDAITQAPLLRYDTAQLSITDAQKAQVRTNIGALGVNQGTANAGKFIVVGSDGNITAVTMQTWQGGSY